MTILAFRVNVTFAPSCKWHDCIVDTNSGNTHCTCDRLDLWRPTYLQFSVRVDMVGHSNGTAHISTTSARVYFLCNIYLKTPR